MVGKRVCSEEGVREDAEVGSLEGLKVVGGDGAGEQLGDELGKSVGNPVGLGAETVRFPIHLLTA